MEVLLQEVVQDILEVVVAEQEQLVEMLVHLIVVQVVVVHI
jgi:hypothetical protein